MKIEHRPSPSGARVSVVTLETAEEAALSEEELVQICQNLQGIEYDHRSDSYQLNGRDFGPETTGGTVEMTSDRRVRVTVLEE